MNDTSSGALRVGIDASNLRGGGGITHLVELLRVAQPEMHRFQEIVIWGGGATLNQLEERPWLRLIHDSMLDRSLPSRIYWQQRVLDRLAVKKKCTILFVPGGSFSGEFRPFVTMSRNMLPFELAELRRAGFSSLLPKLLLIRKSQMKTFRQSDGLIFLTKYAKAVVNEHIHKNTNRIALIPHGVSERFRYEPRPQREMSHYSADNPLRLLYVSPVTFYKHQWHVIDAIHRLREEGLSLVLDLVGVMGSENRRFDRAVSYFDPQGVWVQYHGKKPYSQLHDVYQNADLFVFASSCENMPNTLLEAMAAGLPIASSDRGPMPELLGDAGVYFDPENPSEIADAIRLLLEDPVLRERNARAAYERAQSFTWERCARETFNFIAQVANDYSA